MLECRCRDVMGQRSIQTTEIMLTRLMKESVARLKQFTRSAKELSQRKASKS